MGSKMAPSQFINDQKLPKNGVYHVLDFGKNFMKI